MNEASESQFKSEISFIEQTLEKYKSKLGAAEGEAQEILNRARKAESNPLDGHFRQRQPRRLVDA